VSRRDPKGRAPSRVTIFGRLPLKKTPPLV
jgi:hypothetical protein